ncbi:MAG: hypothetical protein KGN84_09530 [Acidobacteriota bacterium]|nr:hypothetical protein [Acidobacteriota bacterium]
MLAGRTPFVWPDAWKSDAAFHLVHGTVIDTIVTMDEAVAKRAAAEGLQSVSPHAAPKGVSIIEGSVAGIKLGRFGSSAEFSSGPTGEPWVNSNVWPVRLARARKPENAVWIRTQPPDNTGGAAFPYIVMIADAALAGGRWAIALDDPFAQAIAQGQPAALATWRKIASAAAYFTQRAGLDAYRPEAVIAIVSDFSKSFEHETLNLVTRSGQQYRVELQESLTPASLKGLRAVLAPGAQPPPASVRATLLDFVRNGGLLITAAGWGAIPGGAASNETHPRFRLTRLGGGAIAEPKEPMTDPYVLANDAAILVSHRYDLLRFWNGGAMSALYTSATDRKRGAVQVLFYSNRPASDVTVRVAGAWRTAAVSTLDRPLPAPVHLEQQKGGVEIHLPAIAQYVAIELEA